MLRKKNPVLVKISIKVISTVFLLLHVTLPLLNPTNSSVNGGSFRENSITLLNYS